MVSSISQTSQIASQLFSKLDTKNQGYIEKSDLASAFSQIGGTSNDDTSVEDVFAALDSDSDGKVTESELSSVMSKLQDELESQFNQMRMQGMSGQSSQGMSGMPPPPPPGNDSGFTKEELTQQLSEADSTDSARSSLISKVVSNFEAADTDGDGKVTFQEATAYDESTQTATTTSDASSSKTAESSDAQIMKKIMELMHAYSSQTDTTSSLSSLLSVSA
jgi:Ca2+-binding EF-hand superfamily protein